MRSPTKRRSLRFAKGYGRSVCRHAAALLIVAVLPVAMPASAQEPVLASAPAEAPSPNVVGVPGRGRVNDGCSARRGPPWRCGQRVRLPSIRIDDLLDDLFRPIARDGAGIVEIAIKLQGSLAEIAAMAPSAHGLLAGRAADALARSQAAMTFASDLECARAVYRSHWTAQSSDAGAAGSPRQDVA